MTKLKLIFNLISEDRANMPKGKNKKKPQQHVEEVLVLKDKDQLYAKVNKELGDCHMDLKCSDGMTRIGKVRNAIKKKQRISAGDLVLCSMRDFQQDRVDILHKYGDKCVKQLRKMGELVLIEGSGEHLSDDTVEFQADEIDFSEI